MRNRFEIYLLIVCAACDFHISWSQNIVPNPSFELYTVCPVGYSQLEDAQGWHSPSNSSPDYFNECADDLSWVSIPENSFGEENAYSGNAYAGFYAAYNMELPAPPVINDYREYIQCALNEELLPGKTYQISFQLSLSDNSQFGVENIGVYFGHEELNLNTEGGFVGIEPQVVYPNSTPIIQKNGWTLFRDCFVATEAFSHMTIGCFGSNEELNVEVVGSPFGIYYAYYYIDNISMELVNEPSLGADIITCDTPVILNGHPQSENYSWSVNSQDQSIEVTESGTYWLWQQFESCWFEDSVEVWIGEGPVVELGENFEIDFCAQEEGHLAVDYNEDWAYLWSNGSVDSAIVITTPGIYFISVTNSEGCEDFDQIEIYDACVHDVFIPNCFTPDNDGVNDVFTSVIANYDTYELRIWDRWGREVFSASSPEQVWTGGIDSYYCADGTYSYRLMWTTENVSKHLDGFVVLIR